MNRRALVPLPAAVAGGYEVDDLLQALATHAAGDEVEIELKRGSQEQTLTAKLDQRGYGQLKPRPGD